jgi:hypothetical protein
LDQKINV